MPSRSPEKSAEFHNISQYCKHNMHVLTLKAPCKIYTRRHSKSFVFFFFFFLFLFFRENKS